MQEYTESQIINLVHENPELNFIAVATTPWHALGVDAVLHHLKEQGVELKGYIIIRPHQVTGVGLTEENFVMREQGDIQVIQSRLYWEPRSIGEKIKGKLQKLRYYSKNLRNRDEKRTLYWIRPVSPEYDRYPELDTEEYGHRVVTILTDEGVGTYLNSKWLWTWVAYQESGLKQALRTITNCLIAEWYFLPRLYNRGQVQSYQLLQRQGNKWIENQDAGNSYRSILEMNHSTNGYDMYQCAAVFNTAPYGHVITEQDDLRVLGKVAELFHKNDIPVVVKPHPRESGVDRYQTLGGWIEQRKGVAQENILASLEVMPLCMIAFDSTTLVTAALLFHVRGIAVNLLLDREKLTKKNWFQRFDRTFGDIVFIPRSWDELEKYIEKIEDTDAGN